MVQAVRAAPHHAISLLQVGFAVPVTSRLPRWALTPPFHPYLRALRPAGGLLSVVLSLSPRNERRSHLTTTMPCGARTFLALRCPGCPGRRSTRPSSAGTTVAGQGTIAPTGASPANSQQPTANSQQPTANSQQLIKTTLFTPLDPPFSDTGKSGFTPQPPTRAVPVPTDNSGISCLTCLRPW
jgi:hypothetical protein